MHNDLPIMTFASAADLREWLAKHHATSKGIRARIFKVSSGRQSMSFLELLDEGLCFGWSESKRVKGDDESYLQWFTPRRTKGTTSKRNQAQVKQLIKEKRMTAAGLRALGLETYHPFSMKNATSLLAALCVGGMTTY